MHTNSQILAAVLNKFVQPIANSFAGGKLLSNPFISGIENKIRSTGWVSGDWSLMKEVSPFIEPITGAMVKPVLSHYLSQMPDEAIPAMAHGIVDKALENGELSLFEGYISFEKDDLTELKRLLNLNMPVTENETEYILKTE